MRLQLVVNPTAGGGRATKALPSVEQALGDHDVVVTPTRSLEHADKLVAEAVADDRVVVAMGGDGIVGRVAGACRRGEPGGAGAAARDPGDDERPEQQLATGAGRCPRGFDAGGR